MSSPNLSINELNAQRAAQQVAAQAGNVVKNLIGISRLGILKMKNNVLIAGLPLLPLEFCPRRKMHFWHGATPVVKICDAHFGKSCETCKTDSTFPKADGSGFQKCFPTDSVLVPLHVPSLKDKPYEFEVKDDEGNVIETKKGIQNPVKVAFIPFGPENGFLNTMETLEKNEIWFKNLLTLEKVEKGSPRKAKGGWLPVGTITLTDFKKQGGAQAQLELTDLGKKIKKVDNIRDAYRVVYSAISGVDVEAMLPEKVEEHVSSDPANPFLGAEVMEDDGIPF